MRLPTEQELAGLQRMAGIAHAACSGGPVHSSPEQIAALEAADAWIDDALATADKCAPWEVQNLSDGCGGCPAGGYDECLVSPLDARVDLLTSGNAPPDCPLRNGGTVLLTGEP
jgi:hypothetical protein